MPTENAVLTERWLDLWREFYAGKRALATTNAALVECKQDMKKAGLTPIQPDEGQFFSQE